MDKSIHVYAGWMNDEKIGILYQGVLNGAETISFEYSTDWIKHHPNLILDPTMKPVPFRFYSEDRILFGAFQDTCPDRWGRKLIDRRESERAIVEERRPKKFFDTDYMLGIQDVCRSGGFRFKEYENGPFLGCEESYPIPPITSLRTLEEIARGYEEGKDDRWITRLVYPGSSLGGARPKANVLDTDGSMWIAKFPSKHDSYDVGAWEKVTHDLAKMCGIKVSESKLQKFSELGSTFLTKRFDRDLTGNRIHFASAMTMLGLRDGHTEESGFLDLAEITAQISSNPKTDLHYLFQRVVFDIAVANQDNHLRNHGFLLTGEKWMMAPSYDMNPVPNADYLDLYVDTDNGYRSFTKAIETAEFYQIHKAEADDIVNQTTEIIAKNWQNLAHKYQIPESEQKWMAPAFRLSEEWYKTHTQQIIRNLHNENKATDNKPAFVEYALKKQEQIKQQNQTIKTKTTKQERTDNNR